MFTAIMNVVNNRVAKFAEFPTAEDAADHIAEHLQDWPNAFVVENPSGPIHEWWVENQTVTIVPVPPTPEEIEQQEHKAIKNTIKVDSFVQNFINMTPAQVTQYVEDNVINLATAKDVIKKMALMLLILARREFRE